MNRLFYSIPDFSKAADIGRTTTYKEIAAGRLETVKCGSRTLIPVESAQRWKERLIASSDDKA